MNNKYVSVPSELAFHAVIALEETGQYGKADELQAIFSRATPHAAVPHGLTLAAIGCKHFGNPIPQAWYAAAKELLAATPSAPRLVTDDRLTKAIGELVWIWSEVWPLVHGLNSRDAVRERFKKLPDLIETLAATQPEEK